MKEKKEEQSRATNDDGRGKEFVGASRRKSTGATPLVGVRCSARGLV
jgi:hypothetical protein